jgi:hypothetical protein
MALTALGGTNPPRQFLPVVRPSPWPGLAVPLALAAAPAGVLLLLGPARFVVLGLGFLVIAPA